MEENNSNLESPKRSLQADIGQRLRSARERHGMSIEEVAKALNLSPRHIQSLEDDDYQALPGATYIRGYIRSYAQHLGIDGKDLTERFNQLPIAYKHVTLTKLSPQPQLSLNDRVITLSTILVAAIIFLLAAIWWYNKNDSDRHVPKTASTFPQTNVLRQEQASQNEFLDVTGSEEKFLLPSSTGESQITGSVKSETNIDDSTSEKGTASEKTVKQDSETGVSESRSRTSMEQEKTPMQAQPDSQGNRTQITVRTTDESWLDIRDALDSKLLYETVPGGRVITLNGIAPFKIFVGNPDAVQIELDQLLYEANRFRRGQVARFVLPPTRQ